MKVSNGSARNRSQLAHLVAIGEKYLTWVMENKSECNPNTKGVPDLVYKHGVSISRGVSLMCTAYLQQPMLLATTPETSNRQGLLATL
jgi:hypothetical protein